MIDPPQICAVRSLLTISRSDLALISEVGIATIKRLEGAADVLRITWPPSSMPMPHMPAGARPGILYR